MRQAGAVPAGERNRGIDTLRGMSIVFVILNHVGLRIPLAKTALAGFLPTAFLRDLNYNGYEAVFIFFVVSGFLITRRAHEHWGDLRAIPLRDFYVRRGARILPCLLALVGVLAMLHLAGSAHYVIAREGQSLTQAAFAALGLYLNWYEGVTGYLPASWDVLWSLSIEEVFYLGFPLLCLLCGGTRWFVVILAALVLSMPFTHAAASGNEIWQEKAYLPGMAAIAVGILAALVARHASPPSARVAFGLRLAGAIGIGSVFFAGPFIWHWLRDGYLLLLTVCAAMLVLGLHWHAASNARRVPGLGWLRSCGRLSYEIYLTHMFCVWVVVDMARGIGTSPAWGWIWYPPALALSWLLGWIVARGFSVPCETRLRRSFSWRAQLPPAPVTVRAEV